MRVTPNSLAIDKPVFLRFRIELKFRHVVIFWRGEDRSNQRKTS